MTPLRAERRSCCPSGKEKRRCCTPSDGEIKAWIGPSNNNNEEVKFSRVTQGKKR